MRWLFGVLGVSMLVAYVTHYVTHNSVTASIASSVAIILMSKLMGTATEQTVPRLGQTAAGFVYSCSSNTAEVVVQTFAVIKGLNDIVLAGIVGSMIQNILLVLGMSIYLGCRKHGTLTFNKHTGRLYVNQFFIVAAVLMLTTLFKDQIPKERMQIASSVQAAVLLFAYVYFNRLSRTDGRFKELRNDVEQIEIIWSMKRSVLTLVLCALATVSMSEILTSEITTVAVVLAIPRMFIGYGLFPLLGNAAEHFVAISQMMKKRADLALAIAVGSPNQVGMIVTPIVVLVGFLCGNPIILDFSGIPWGLLVLSLVGGSMAINDGHLTKEKGVMLLALWVTGMVFFALAN